MIEKTIVINMLEDIKSNLKYNNRERALKDVNIYIKNIELTVNKKIKKLTAKCKLYRKKYGENHILFIITSKKLDKEIHKIFSKQD